MGANVSESGNDISADLERRQKEAEIRKTEAEAAALAKPQGFFHANWVAVFTTVAMLLTALGGSSALISALAALRTADQTLSYKESVVDANAKLNQAKKESLDAQERKDEANKKTDELIKKQADLDAQTKALALAKDGLDQTLAAERAEVDNGIAYSNALKSVIASKQNALTQLEAQSAATRTKLQSEAKNLQNPAAKNALARVATTISVPSAAVSGRLVYLEYLDKQTGTAMTGLQAKLKNSGFAAPGIQQIDQRHLNAGQPNEVRYFRPEDKALAQQVADLANGYFAVACVGSPKIEPRKHGSSTPTTQLEVWTGFACKT